MKRFFTKIVRFFWSWGFLKFVLWTITLVILLYVEEDWRGARNWAATKAEWEAKGESFDPAKFIPPPVPDEQNLAAIPLFRLKSMPTANDQSYSAPVALQRAMRTDLPGNNVPLIGHLQESDMANIRSTIATDYAEAFKGATPSQNTLAQFEALYPFLADFRAAAVARPYFRLPEDYAISPPASRPLYLITSQIKLSKILTLHAILALDQHQPGLALDDIKLNYQILSGVKRDPTLVSGLVAIGITAIARSAISYGLAIHAWNDAQLAEIDRMLEPMNFLADYQFAMRSEAKESVANIDYFKNNAHQSDFRGLFEMMSGMSDRSYSLTMFDFIIPRWPGGWWDSNKRQMANFLLHELSTVDPGARRVFPQVDLDLQHEADLAKARWDSIAPWNIWFSIALPPLSVQTEKFAQGQVHIDEMRIACALERYRLAHNAYPELLGQLAPAYIDELPHDIMNGQPYRYKLRPDGTFLLYSVGWNQTDDGGKVVYRTENSNAVDYSQGDWVWPTPSR